MKTAHTTSFKAIQTLHVQGAQSQFAIGAILQALRDLNVTTHELNLYLPFSLNTARVYRRAHKAYKAGLFEKEDGYLIGTYKAEMMYMANKRGIDLSGLPPVKDIAKMGVTDFHSILEGYDPKASLKMKTFMVTHLPEDEVKRFSRILIAFGASLHANGLERKNVAMTALMDFVEEKLGEDQ